MVAQAPLPLGARVFGVCVCVCVFGVFDVRVFGGRVFGGRGHVCLVFLVCLVETSDGLVLWCSHFGVLVLACTYIPLYLSLPCIRQ